MSKVYNVNVTVEGLACSATVTTERQTSEDPGGVWVEDITVVDEEDGAYLNFEELDDDMQEKIQEAAIEAAREGEGSSA